MTSVPSSSGSVLSDPISMIASPSPLSSPTKFSSRSMLLRPPSPSPSRSPSPFSSPSPLFSPQPLRSSPSVSPLDRHVSREELGKGNHAYFRRNKTLETIRHVHECGKRLTYGDGRSFWARGRLLLNGNEVFVCCDEAMQPETLEAAFTAAAMRKVRAQELQHS